MNLPIYTCSMCKKYTFDPQQSSLHARQVHNGRVGVILMLPLEEIPVPSNPTTVITEKNSKYTPAKSPVTPNKLLTLQVKKWATDERNSPAKHKFECRKCNRQFDRERQMNRHKCIEVISRKQSPRREGGQKKTVVVEITPQKTEAGQKKKVVVEITPQKSAASQEKSLKDASKQTVQEVNPSSVQPGGSPEKILKNTKSSKNGTNKKSPEKIPRGSFPEVVMDEFNVITVEGGKNEDKTDKDSQDEDYELVDNSRTEEESQDENEDDGWQETGGNDDGGGDDDDDDDDDELEAEEYEDMDIKEPNDGGLVVDVPPIPSPGRNPTLLVKHQSQIKEPAEIVDEMVMQWKDRGPPTAAEIDKFIKVLRGGIESGKGEPIEFYMCLICRKVFKTRNALKPHIYSHIGYRPYACTLCGYSATHSSALNVHTAKHAKHKYKCWYSGCSFNTKWKEDFEKHRLTHCQSVNCELCLKSFKSQSTLLGHLCTSHTDDIKEGNAKQYYMRMVMTGRRTSQIVLFECDICGMKMKTKKRYYNHIKIHKTLKVKSEKNTKSASEGTPGSSNSTPHSRRRKMVQLVGPGKLKCPLCEHRCNSENLLLTHLATHPFVYRCCMCEENFLTYGALNEHVGSHSRDVVDFNPQEKINESLRRSMYHGGQMDKALEADKLQWAQRRTGAEAPKSAMTGSTFDELMSKITIPSERVTHEELQELGDIFTKTVYKRLTPSILRYIHLRFGNVECGVCGKLFPKVGLCKDHTKKHTQAKEYKCTKCPYQVSVKLNLQKHMAKVHGEGEQFHCEECKLDLFSKEAFDRHIQRKHTCKTDMQGPYTCTWCNTVEDKVETMKNHIVNTHPMMPLTESTKILGTGVVIHREKGAPFLVCEVCNETFRRICDLRRHMWKHSSVKRYTCELCDYGSDKRGNIISHMRKHSGEKTFACQICTKMYKTEQSLKLHVKTAHLKLKPYKCESCDYAASQPVHLRRHKVLHHSEGERRKFRCAICSDYKASDLQVVKRHYAKKHPSEVMNVSKCCPDDASSLYVSKKDKHQVIQVVPSLPAPSDAAGLTEPASEVAIQSDPEQTGQVIEDSAVIEAVDQAAQLGQGMTIEVVLQEDQAQLVDINSALPDVINALAALQESELNCA